MSNPLANSHLLTWPTRLAKSRLVAVGRLDVDPVPGQRARARKGGKAYYSQRYTTYREQLGWAIKQSLIRLSGDPNGNSAYGARVAFARSSRQRTDVDNILKSVLDAATGIVWIDDSQVAEANIRNCGVQRDNPYLEFAFYIVASPDGGVPDCQVCHKAMTNWFPSIKRTTCGGTCAEALRRENRAKRKRVCGKCNRTFRVSGPRVRADFCESCHKDARQCDQCGKAFAIARSKAVGDQRRQFCSRECSIAWWRSRPATGVTIPCPQCGAPKAARYKTGVCRACAIEGRTSKSNYWRSRVPAPAAAAVGKVKH